MQISSGIIESAQKVVIYGPEGIGKSYFASKFPNPVFIDTEGSTKHMDVARLPKPSSWTMLMEQVRYVKNNPDVCDTLIIDTADWAEQLCKVNVCEIRNKKSLADIGYGNGFVYLVEEIGRLLNLLEELIELGINAVLTAHATMRKFEQPDEMGSYDRWEMKLEKKVFPLIKEWADMVLFANYKTFVINVDDQGATKGKNKVQGGKRVMYTTHHPCWDAKNRHGLLPEHVFEFDEIRHCIPVKARPIAQSATTGPPIDKKEVATLPSVLENIEIVEQVQEKVSEKAVWDDVGVDITPPPNIPKPLADLMLANKVSESEIQKAVESKGYYPKGTQITNYDPNFINGVLVGAWDKVFKMIQDLRVKDEIPL